MLNAEYLRLGKGKKKEGGGLVRIQTKEDFARSLDKRHMALESLR